MKHQVSVREIPRSTALHTIFPIDQRADAEKVLAFVHRELEEGRAEPAGFALIKEALIVADDVSKMMILTEYLGVLEYETSAGQVREALNLLMALRAGYLEETLVATRLHEEERQIPETLEALLIYESRAVFDSVTLPLLIRALKTAPKNLKITTYIHAYHTLRQRGSLARFLRAVALLVRAWVDQIISATRE